MQNQIHLQNLHVDLIYLQRFPLVGVNSAIMGWVYNASPEAEAASQWQLILGISLALTILMVIVVSLRLMVRAQASRLGAADWVMVMSMVRVLS